MKKSNVIGALVMTGAILVSLPLGVSRSFSRLRQDFSSEYYYDNTGYAIYQGIDSRVASAKNLLALAEKYRDQDPRLKDDISSLQYALDLMENFWIEDFQDTGVQVEYNQRLGKAARTLADRLDALELSEKDSKYPRKIMADMDAEQDKLERSSFNDAILKYNQTLDTFPGNLVTGLLGIRPITPFGQGSQTGSSANISTD